MDRRTTVRLEASLLREAKRLAADSGRTLTAVIADALREAVGRTRTEPTANPPLPRSRRSGGTWPGVNLDSWAEVLDRMDDRDAAARR